MSEFIVICSTCYRIFRPSISSLAIDFIIGISTTILCMGWKAKLFFSISLYGILSLGVWQKGLNDDARSRVRDKNKTKLFRSRTRRVRSFVHAYVFCMHACKQVRIPVTVLLVK